MLSTRGRRLVALACAAGAGAALAYKYGAFDKARDRLERVARVFQTYCDAAQTAGEVADGVLKDLQAFLASGGDQVPQSVSQLAKLLSSSEAARSESLTALNLSAISCFLHPSRLACTCHVMSRSTLKPAHQG